MNGTTEQSASPQTTDQRPIEALLASHTGTHLLGYLRLFEGIDPQGYQFAFYFYVDDERVATEWYGPHLVAAHACPPGGSMRILAFAQHRDSGAKYSFGATLAGPDESTQP